MSKECIAWAAGVIEADGAIMFKVHPHAPGKKQARIRVTMADEDIVKAIHSVLKVGLLRGPLKESYSNNKHNLIRPPKHPKPLWLWEINKQQDLVNVLTTIRPWLHSRRGAMADAVLDFMRQKGITPQ